MGLDTVGWRDGEKMQTIVTELKKKKELYLEVSLNIATAVGFISQSPSRQQNFAISLT